MTSLDGARLDAARQAIAARALAQRGTPFKLFGRTGGKALDCVGLALIAAGPHWNEACRLPPYRLKGCHGDVASAALGASRFARAQPAFGFIDGDIAIVAPDAAQLHLMVRATPGWVHADAGLGCVALRPGLLPWPLHSLWRLDGI